MINAMRYTKDLENSGFSKEQANTAIKVVGDIMDSNFATKQDIQIASLELRAEMKEISGELRNEMQEIKSELRGDMRELKTSLESQMVSMHNKIIIKLSGVMIILMSAMVTILKLL